MFSFKKSIIWKLSIISALIIGFTFTSCKDDEEENANTFTVRMTDSPGNYAALNVEISRVDVFLESEGWITLNSETQSHNVIDLNNGAEAVIASSNNLEIGNYTKVKVVFGANNSITVNDGSSSITSDVTVNNQEVVIEINENVQADSDASILIDFDVANSVEENNGNYDMDPQMREVERENTGAQGQVKDEHHCAVVATSSTGVEYSTYTNAQGEFMLRGLAEGSYTIVIHPQSNTGLQLPTEFTIQNITVVEGSFTQMGVIDITL